MDENGIKKFQEQNTRAFRDRYRKENKVVFDKTTDGLTLRLYGTASQLSDAYLQKRHRIFHPKELELVYSEAVSDFYEKIRPLIKETKAAIKARKEAHEAEIKEVFETRDLQQAEHERAQNSIKLKAMSLTELKAIGAQFIDKGGSGFEAEYYNTVAAELRSRGENEIPDQMRLMDAHVWHVSEPWKGTETSKIIAMEEEDITTIENAIESGTLMLTAGDGKYISKDVKKYFPPELELR
jgi:hypothetical protein